ncbi:cysteine-rich receptor-like protein kinase 10 [Magnolia sinica]|uniref:cysteine-rich receptor-like protein kinase 10 n=1 Tax=Magnolia sinica TaxID=86752 RepID=UPI002658907E|nr:cysteine-rich receptor-like protein kinase 10 [Magnolia sinica]
MVYGNQSRIIIIIVVVSVLGLAALFGSCIYCYLQRRNGGLKDREEENHAPLTQNGFESVNESMQGDQTPEVRIIDLASIQAATNDFSDENKLGEGGFGPVYKGMLSDGKEIAVKRLSRSSGQGLEEFRNEVTLIAKLQHRNLVSLLYWCVESGEKLLIYEYMPNTSLDVFIFDPIKRRQLGWEGLDNIIGGIVKGLVYLHEDSRLRIIHRDLKASNVLLDHEMKAKISDFGMARFLGGDQSQVNTNRVVGTLYNTSNPCLNLVITNSGYMAPEYVREGLFSVKSDVYSFGVLLLEIVSGKKNISPHLAEDAQSLAWDLWRNGRATELIDPLLADCPTNKVSRWIHIGLLCVQQDAADRPTMSSVIVMLGSKSTTIQQPKQPEIYFGGLLLNQINFNASARAGSNNDVTISALEPR